MPPVLAGRENEITEFRMILKQSTILENLVLTGLRGVGKTVLLETFKPLAIHERWLWVGTDLSESAGVSEETMVIRLLTDLAVVTSQFVIHKEEKHALGFLSKKHFLEETLNYTALMSLYNRFPGLVSDRLKAIMEVVWRVLSSHRIQGVIFAYDEAQTLADHTKKDQYPLSMLLDVFQSVQRKNLPFMLLLTGLPTLYSKLVDARTFSERMFRIIVLDKLTKEQCHEAIVKPLQGSTERFSAESVNSIIEESDGYPYFIQFICKEAFDELMVKKAVGEKRTFVAINEITRKLDRDFFAGRWTKVTERQRDLLVLIAQLNNCDKEFTVQEIVNKSTQNSKSPFSSSHANQLLSALTQSGLVYKNRHGRYSFAVPLLGRFIRRLGENEDNVV